MNQIEEKIFFDAAFKALKYEDNTLQVLFASNSQIPEYKTQSTGITFPCLREEPLVYVVFKELLKSNLPYQIRLEYYYSYVYPQLSARDGRADMAFLKNGKVDSFCEFKIYRGTSSIKSDIEKFFHKKVAEDKYLMVFEVSGVSLTKSKNHLNKHLPRIDSKLPRPQIDILHCADFPTKIFNEKLRAFVNVTGKLYLIKVIF